MITPRPRLVHIAVGIALLALFGLWFPQIRDVLFVCNIILLGLGAADLWLSTRPRAIKVHRSAPPVMSVGLPHTVELELYNPTLYSLEVSIHDHAPAKCGVTDQPLDTTLLPQRRESLRYRLSPQRRGDTSFSYVDLRVKSRFGLWTLTERRALPHPIRVYPNLRTVEALELLVPRNRTSFEGLRVGKLRGEGGEFDRLREYRREDELRRVDWKASAKHSSLISREYRIERNQHLLILLDAGQSMANVSGGITHLDRGLNAAVLLSHLALSQGDNVSFVAFSNRVNRSVGPLRGKPAIQTLLQQTYDLEPQLMQSDYQLACEEALRRQKRRALVILLTHALDEQHLRALAPYARLLSSSHLLLCLLIEDTGLVEMAERVPTDVEDAFAIGAAAEMVRAKRRQVAELGAAGARVFEAVPETLSAVVVNQYLELKARRSL